MYEDDFREQWKTMITMLSAVMTDILKANKNKISIEDLNQIIRIETGKWSNRLLYQGSWLNKIDDLSPDYSAEFHCILKDIHFDKQLSLRTPSFMPYLFVICLVAIGCYFLFINSNAPWWRIVGSVIIPPFMIGSILYPFWQKSREKFMQSLVDKYLAQLDIYCERLITICRKIDTL